jgi:hypothetical protein
MRAVASLFLLVYCGASGVSCDSTDALPKSRPAMGDPCRSECSDFELAGHAFVALLNAKRYRPSIEVDTILRRLHGELCAGRPDYIPEAGDEQWIEHTYPMEAIGLARSAQCGEFVLTAGALPGPRGAHELARHESTIAQELLLKWSNEHIGAAILYLLRFDARSYESQIEMLFDLMCGTAASSQHLHDASTFDFTKLRDYEFATCDGFSYGGLETSGHGTNASSPRMSMTTRR